MFLKNIKAESVWFISLKQHAHFYHRNHNNIQTASQQQLLRFQPQVQNEDTVGPNFKPCI